MSPSGVLTGGILIYYLVLLVALLLLALVLIAGIRKQRRELNQLKESPVNKPFPQDTKLPILRPSNLDAAERDVLIREAYAEWLQSYVMVDSEPGRAFIYSGVQASRPRGRQALAATSLGQALGMLIQLSMAGEDLMAQSRFERLYLYLLAHPAADSEDLAAWQSFPDELRMPPVDADLNAEMLISLVLAAALAQWPQGERVYFARAAELRLDALLQKMKSYKDDPSGEPAFTAAWACDAAAAFTKNQDWKKLRNSKKAPDEQDAAFWVQIWQQGLGALYASGQVQQESLNLAYRLLESSLPEEEDDLRSYTYANSPLAQFAAAVPLLASLGDQEVLDTAWQKLANAKPWRKDGFGASLRLLGMLLLAGRFWLPELDWGTLTSEVDKPVLA